MGYESSRGCRGGRRQETEPEARKCGRKRGGSPIRPRYTPPRKKQIPIGPLRGDDLERVGGDELVGNCGMKSSHVRPGRRDKDCSGRRNRLSLHLHSPPRTRFAYLGDGGRAVWPLPGMRGNRRRIMESHRIKGRIGHDDPSIFGTEDLKAKSTGSGGLPRIVGCEHQGVALPLLQDEGAGEMDRIERLDDCR
jgi:hypothetical protein